MNLLINSLQIVILLQFSSLPIRCNVSSVHNKRIICTFPNDAFHLTGAGHYTVDNIDPQLCTHLLYTFAILDKGTFNISIKDPDADIINKGYEKSVALKFKNPKLKVMISLGGWRPPDDDKPTNKYDELTKQSSTIDTFVSSVMDFLQLHKFDGLNLDYDYQPNSVDIMRFPRLLVALRNAFNSKEYLLSVTLPAAVSGYSLESIGRDYDVPSLNENVDFVNLRTFFYHGPEWKPARADHHSSLYKRPWETRNLNSNYSVNYWRDRNLDSHKINLGIPLFGLSWTLSHATTNYTPPAKAEKKGPPGDLIDKRTGILAFHEICDAVRHNGWQEFSDPNEMIGPYAVSQNGGDKIWVGYDDPAMAAVKSKFILSEGLGGASLSDISYDDFHGKCGRGSNPITTAVYNTLIGIDEIIRIKMIPDVEEQTIKAGQDLILTCETSHSKLFWVLPDLVVRNPFVDVDNRLKKPVVVNDTGTYSTMILSDTRPSDTGRYECRDGWHRTDQYFYVTNDEKLIFIDDTSFKLLDTGIDGKTLKKGESFLLPCKPTHPNVTVSLTHFPGYLTEKYEEFWLTDPRFIREDTKISLDGSNPRWSFVPRKGMTLKDPKISDAGRYECVGEMNNVTTRLDISLRFKEMELELVGDPIEGGDISLICRLQHRGLRDTKVNWFYHNNDTWEMLKINETNSSEVFRVRSKINDARSFITSQLDIFNINKKTFTSFRCASNIPGVAPETISFKIKINNPPLNEVIISVVLLVIIATGIGIGIKLYLNQRNKNKLLLGNPGGIRDEIPMEEKIDCLPYDERWEFPRHRLKIGEQLGAGCFGRILKAEAVGLKDSEETVKTVAVKTTKSVTTDVALEALVSELKILIYLGSHLNVVNLLGACTKQIHKGQLFVIVEYCRFGDLQSFLVKGRNNFINQVDESGQLKVEGVTKENRRERAEMESPSGAYGVIEMTTISIEQTSFNPPEPLNPPISTRDLISWSFQIARGMGYLASKKILHGDLAARNVLLADDGVVKVADFGMAKKMYYEDNYEMTSQRLMPAKWMAIESLKDKIFSTQSDVWSYGVVLWEMFTLGQTPYPGMAGHEMVREIQKGFRMEKPELAPHQFGEMMSNCWQTDPNERPTFLEMEEAIVPQLESSATSIYLNMNDPYTKLNEERENANPTAKFGLSKLLKT